MDSLRAELVSRLVRLYLSSEHSSVAFPLLMLDSMFAAMCAARGYESTDIPIDFYDGVLSAIHERGLELYVLRQQISLMGVMTDGLALIVPYELPRVTINDLQTNVEQTSAILAKMFPR